MSSTPTATAHHEDAFEDEVRGDSTRTNKDDCVVGFYVSPRLAQARNVRAPLDEQLSDDITRQALLFKGNARFDADPPAAALVNPKSVLNRLVQVRKHANHKKFVNRMKQHPNGKNLCKRIQAEVALVIAKYSPNTNTSTSSTDDPNPNVSAVQGDAAGEDEPEIVDQQQPTISPVSMTPSAKPKAESCPRSRLVPALRVDPDRFAAYLVYFKNPDLQLATEILLSFNAKSKDNHRNWIDTTTRSSPEYASMRAPKKQSDSKYNKVFLKELRYLALVAAALMVYGEGELSARYDERAMASWKDIALISDEARNFPEQKACLRQSKIDRLARVSKEFPDQPEFAIEALAKRYHAAHYVPLDLVIQWGSKLAPENCLSAEIIRYIFNQQCNLKAVPARVNQKDHRDVERLIAEVIIDGRLSKYMCKTWLECRQVMDRRIEIARKVQSPEIRDALFKAGGQEFYALVGRTFQQIEKEFVDNGFAFGKIWGREEEEDDVTVKAEAVLSQVSELNRE